MNFAPNKVFFYLLSLQLDLITNNSTIYTQWIHFKCDIFIQLFIIIFFSSTEFKPSTTDPSTKTKIQCDSFRRAWEISTYHRSRNALTIVLLLLSLFSKCWVQFRYKRERTRERGDVVRVKKKKRIIWMCNNVELTIVKLYSATATIAAVAAAASTAAAYKQTHTSTTSQNKTCSTQTREIRQNIEGSAAHVCV